MSQLFLQDRLTATEISPAQDLSQVYIEGRSSLQTEIIKPETTDPETGLITDPDMIRKLYTEYSKIWGRELLGILVAIRRRFLIDVGSEQLIETSAAPHKVTYWVGQSVKLMTQQEAENVWHGGQTALYWATVNSVQPPKVVKANNGLYYPASDNDQVVKLDT